MSPHSSAGTPGISDPGSRITAAVQAAGLRVMPIPGASAVTTALSASGLDLHAGFCFAGFAPEKAMALTNEDRGGLVGAFIVVDGDEVLSVTGSGQVVRSPIDENFRATGRSTQGVKFVSPKKGDTVAVVARSVERAPEVEEAAEEAEQAEQSASAQPDATIEAEGGDQSQVSEPEVESTEED